MRALASDPRDPDRIYLGTADGILYRSDNAGVDWKRVRPGFPRTGCSLDELVVDSRGVLFVGYWEVHGRGGGVARSEDQGKTFTVLKGIEGESVRALALAPSDNATLAAGTLSGVFITHDHGKSWARVTPKGHPDLRNIESLAFDPGDREALYAGTWHLAWKTSNGGADWASIHEGMIDDSDVMTLAVHEKLPRLVYATACSGVYRSTDAGAHWTKLQGIPYSARRTRAFALGVEEDSLLLAGTTEGLWMSENRGRTWSRTTSKELVVNAVVTLPGGAVLLGTEEAGVLRSTDRGRTWTPSNRGFTERFVYRLLFDEESRRLIAAVWGAPRFGGVFVSRNVGGSWSRLGTGLGGRQVLSLALLNGTILAGTDAGIFVRGPEETSWAPMEISVDGKTVSPRVIELLSLQGSILAATQNGILQSSDGGRSWRQCALGDSGEVFDLAASGRQEVVMAATASGFFVSEDRGESWTKASAPLRVTPHVLAFASRDPRVLFVTTTGGLYRSVNGGYTWKRLGGGLPQSDLNGIAVHPDGRTLFVSDFTWGGVFRSRDGGATWTRMSTEGLGSDRVWTLSVDPEAPERLLAAASAGGLHLLVPARSGTKGRVSREDAADAANASSP